MKTLHRGKLASNPKVLAVRPLTRDDLLCLRDKRPAQNVVKTFRDWHHRIARMVAAGLRPHEVCANAGISRTRYNQYNDDPSFQQLVAEYRLKVDQGFVAGTEELFATVSANTLNAELLIKETLEEAMHGDAERPSLKNLLAISRDGADRIGLPKQKVTQNTNVNLDFASMLEAAARRSGRSNVIDAVPHAPVGTASRPRALPSTPSSAIQTPPPNPVAGGIRRRA